MSERYEVAVIGGGPGGYPAAIRLGQLGKKTCVIEMGHLGGVCLNWGCIPSKAVIHAAELKEEISHANAFGIGTGDAPLELPKLRDWKNGILQKLRGGIKGLLKANGVDHIQGRATLTGPHSLSVEMDGGARAIEFDEVILATGASAIELPFLPRSNPRVWTAQELLELDEIPEHLICVGGGVIGLETACSYVRLGSKITIVELMDALLPGTDPELVKPVARGLKQSGATVHLKTKAKGLEERGGKAVLICEGPDGKTLEIEGDRVLVSIGFRPNSKHLGLDAAGVKTDERGFITVDPYCRTNLSHVYAIGDVTGMPFLAHRATKMGVVAAEVIGGLPAMCDFQAMPMGIFCSPEVATVGLSEAEAREAGHDVVVGNFPFAALGRALAQNATAGLVKLIGDAKTGLLLGVGIVGARANDLIAEAALAIEMGAAVEDLALTVHSHPTFAEALCEAAEDALGHAIHVARPKKKSALQREADRMLLKKS